VFQQLQRPHPVSCKSTRRAGLGVLIQYMDHIEDFSDEPYSDDNFDCCAPDDRYAQAAIFRRFQCLQQHHHSSRRIIHDQHQVCCLPGHDDRSFIVLTETKFSFRCIPVWDRYSPHRTRVEKKNTCDNALTMTSPVHW
jgi:hypothetical protein